MLGPTGAGPTEEQLSAALAEGPRSARERAELHAELARACAAAGRADDAAAHARAARALAARIGSHRVLRLLNGVHGHRLYGQGPSAGSAESSSASAAR